MEGLNNITTESCFIDKQKNSSNKNLNFSQVSTEYLQKSMMIMAANGNVNTSERSRILQAKVSDDNIIKLDLHKAK